LNGDPAQDDSIVVGTVGFLRNHPFGREAGKVAARWARKTHSAWMTLVLYRTRAMHDRRGEVRVDARSIKPLEGSRSRLRWTRGYAN
jgi:hypothetical protein